MAEEVLMATTCVVSFEYVLADGQPAAGTITFSPTSTMTNATENRVLAQRPIVVPLDEAGRGQVTLFRTDDVTWQPTNWGWVVQERITGANTRSFSITLTSATLDLADAAPVPIGANITHFLTRTELDEHAAETTDVHGIADTSLLETADGAQWKADAAAAAAAAELAAHRSATEAVHGITDTMDLETVQGAQTKATAAQFGAVGMAADALADHAAETTSVHGIVDTADLETVSGAQAKADAAQAAAEATSAAALSPVEGRVTALELGGGGEAAGPPLLGNSFRMQAELRATYPGASGALNNMHRVDIDQERGIMWTCSTSTGNLLTAWDLSDPLWPRVLSETTLVSCGDVEVGPNNRLYVSRVNNATCYVYDTTNPRFPRLLGSPTLAANAGVGPQMAVSGTTLFWGTNGSSVLVYDMDNPASPSLLNTIVLGGAMVQPIIHGNVLYSGAGTNLKSYDVSNPASPVPLHTLAIGSSLERMERMGNYMILGQLSSMRVINISNPSAMTIDGFLAMSVSGTRGIAVTGTTAWFACEGSGGSLVAVDCSNPAVPAIAQRAAETSGDAKDVEIYANYAYVVEQINAKIRIYGSA